MATVSLARVCEELATAGPEPQTIEHLRVLLGCDHLHLELAEACPSAPAGSVNTRWRVPLMWREAKVGCLVGTGPHDPAALELLSPLLALSIVHRREVERTLSAHQELQARATRALDLSELVTWLMQARDEYEVEQLGTSAVSTILRVDDGGLLTPGTAGGWVLRVPNRDLVSEAFELEAAEVEAVTSRARVEVELHVAGESGGLARALGAWGYAHAFLVPLDSQHQATGLLLALSTTERTIDPEARVAAAQLSIMISSALDRHRDQRRLSEHRKSLEDAMRLASMGTWELDLQSLQLTWSRELHQLFGGGFCEFTQPHATAEAFFEPDDRFLHQRHLRELLADGVTSPSELRLTTLDGRRLWLRTLYERVVDRDGIPRRVRGVSRDVTTEVTSQLERERALERATRFERLFTLSDTLAAVCDSTGRIVEASPSWTRQLGWQPEELLGRLLPRLVHPADLKDVLALYRQRLQSGQTAGSVVRLRARDGSWRWVSWTAALDGGRLYAAATDVTSLEVTSERLRRSQEQLQQAGALARVGGWDLDVLTNTLTWSREVCRLFEVPSDFAPDLSNTAAFYRPADLTLLTQHWDACRDHGASFDLELEVISSKGRPLWVRHLGNAERVDGRTLRLFGAYQDITDQRGAREAALTASRIKSQFLANTSHEIRTPLNGILGMTQLTLETSLSAEQRENLQAVHTSGQNLLAIVNDILDISKIESGRLELEKIPFSMQRAVFDAVRGQAGRAHAKGLELIVDVAPDLPTQFLGDPVRVGQIVHNLVGNAVKFTEHGEVVVRVTLAGKDVHLTVQDSGIGIPADRIGSIFEAFTQADGSTNRRFGGTGLGLTITQELVKAMGGLVEVESQVGQGSTFRVTLTLDAATSPAAVVRPAQRARVMVVSGNARSCEVTVRQLEHLGCDVSTASAEGAMRALLIANETAPIEVMLIDHELDGTSGIELSEAISDLDGINRVARVLLARTTRRPSANEVQASGVRRVLTRPFSTDELAEVMAQVRPGSGVTRLVPASVPAPTRRSLNVLLAEDNAINARLARRLLERLGHQVTHVTDGALAVEAVAQEPWDVVLMDMQMPVLDGLEATRTIRLAEKSSGRHVPIVALTANAMKGDDQICLAAGMDAYLTKPIDLDKLARVLDEQANQIREMSA